MNCHSYGTLRGDMSLVGPRPEVGKWVDAYPGRWASVLEVRPGVTDLASILYRDEESLLAKASDPGRMYREEILPNKLTLYEDYVAKHSFCGDLVIIAKTLQAIFLPRTAMEHR